MRVYVRALAEQGVIEHRRRTPFPAATEYAITPEGASLLRVAEVVQGWLGLAPGSPIELGEAASKSALKALVEGWSTNVVRALAARPLSLAELSRLIPTVSYPSLQRRLGAMRVAGLLETRAVEGQGRPYAATDWLRRAVVPLASAAGWERRTRFAAAQPIGRLDVEAAFLLAVPLLEAPEDFTATCRLTVELQGGDAPVYAGVLVSFKEGQVVAYSSRLEGEVEAWVTGSPGAWLRELNGIDRGGLEVGGDSHLVAPVLTLLSRVASIPV